MILRVLVALIFSAGAFSAAAQETYVADPAHSQPSFEAKHIGMTVQFGGFSKSSTKITLDRAAKTGTVDVAIDATSVHTFDPRLDAVVKGERFFNVEKFPTITFKSSHVVFDGDRPTTVEGTLTLLGVTKPVSLKVISFTCGEQPFNKKPMCAANAVATIKRSDWGMTNGLEIGNPADEVTLRVPVEGYRQ